MKSQKSYGTDICARPKTFACKHLHNFAGMFVWFSYAEKLLFRNIQPAPPTLSLTAAGSDVILLDTKLVPCCISPSAELMNTSDIPTAKQTGNSLTVGAADAGSTAEHRLDAGSSPTGSDCFALQTRYCTAVHFNSSDSSSSSSSNSCCCHCLSLIHISEPTRPY